jgi:DNA polymerase-3 subunit epsilon
VYIYMTRGQESLVIEVPMPGAGGDALARRDLSTFALPVLRASDAECAEHEAVLTALDKESKGRTVWRRLEPAAQTAAGG